MAIGTTALVTALSYALPEDYAATGVGFAFLAVTYWFALRPDDPGAERRFGLALGGLLERGPIVWRRLVSDGARATLWAVGIAVVTLPPFWIGYVFWWNPSQPFSSGPWSAVADQALGQLLVIALPEEAFYRGYLQTLFDEAWKPKWRVLGAHIGPGLIVASALFAGGHFLTEPHPNRLAVFVPALVFGWLRARTGGIGAGLLYHAMCNLFASYLAQSYGFHG